MKKNKLIYAILILLFLFLMIMYDGWQTEVLFYVVIFVPIVLGIVALYYSRKIRIYFDEVEEYCQRDNHIKKYIMIKNDTRFAIPRIEMKVCIEDYMGQKAYRTLVVNSEALTIRNFAMEMSFEHYGMMTIRIEKVRVYDYLGIFAFRKKVKLDTVIYVFPDYSENVCVAESKQVPDGNIPEIQLGKTGSDRSEVMENDEYHEGDDIRNIHWKLSSKSDKLIVKHFGDPKEENINIYVDLKVDKNARYDCCDGILSALYAVVSSCEQQGLVYKIWGCSGEEMILADLRNIIEGISEGDSLANGYQCIGQIQKHGGTGICITTAPIEKKELEPSIRYVEYNWQKDKKEVCEIKGDTVLKIAVEPKRQGEKDFFIRENNDKIRIHQKVNYHEHSDGYLPLQAIIALLASLIAVLSIYDVIYIQASGALQAVFTVIFVVMHYVIYYLTMNMEESAGRVRWRTILILCGYVAVILIAGPGNITEGVRSVIDLFQETLVSNGSYYGFLEFKDPYIDWLLLLVIYAVVDVIFNFCADFLLGIHLLVIVPLLSICMIVGSMPPTSIACMAAVYLPLIFVVHQCVRHGRARKRKYLSDDYMYTGNVAVSAGIVTGVVAVAVLVYSILFVHAGGYETPRWMKTAKRTITRLMEIDDWNDLLQLRNVGAALFTEDTDGWLDDTKKVKYTGDIVLSVVVQGNVGDSFYLKEYAGTHYNEKAWLERTQTEINEEEEYMRKVFNAEGYDDYRNVLTNDDLYGVADFREHFTFLQAHYEADNMLRVWSGSLNPYRMQVITAEDQMNSIPQPYYSEVTGIPIWGDGYLYGVGTDSPEKEDEGYGRYFEYNGYNISGYPDISGVKDVFGQYPYIYTDAARKKLLQTRNVLEEYYSLWIEDNYLSVVPELKDEMAQFEQVRVIYEGEEYQLNSGDRQYLEIGYEPYIQYVRKFFDDQDYVYNLNITRKNNYNDFISDFMKRKSGYCIHYASTAVMMFRTMGIPARYVEGFYVTEKHKAGLQSDGILYEVPDSAAHAWVEIYCKGAGWIPVEVTPGNDNFEIRQEQITTQPVEKESTTKRPQESVKPTETTTKATKKPVAAETTTILQTEQKNSKKITDYWQLLIPVVLVLAMLVRYQYKCQWWNRLLQDSDKTKRTKALEAYFRTVTASCCKAWKEYETNVQKSACILDSVPVPSYSEEMVLEILELLDKMRYAPEGRITDEELAKVYEFLTAYGKCGYEQIKVHEKFAFKYIKCLYLKAK